VEQPQIAQVGDPPCGTDMGSEPATTNGYDTGRKGSQRPRGPAECWPL